MDAITGFKSNLVRFFVTTITYCNGYGTRSFQVLLDGVPFVLVWAQCSFCDGTMEGVPLLGTNAVMSREESLVVIDQ